MNACRNCTWYSQDYCDMYGLLDMCNNPEIAGQEFMPVTGELRVKWCKCQHARRGENEIDCKGFNPGGVPKKRTFLDNLKDSLGC